MEEEIPRRTDNMSHFEGMWTKEANYMYTDIMIVFFRFFCFCFYTVLVCLCEKSIKSKFEKKESRKGLVWRFFFKSKVVRC